MSQSGIRKTPGYVEKVDSFPRPTTIGGLREFLGLVNFQRKFVDNCSEIQKPLSSLTGGKRNKELKWSPEMVEAFEIFDPFESSSILITAEEVLVDMSMFDE